MPQGMMPPPGNAPAAMPTPDPSGMPVEQEAAGGGYTICLEVKPDGSFSVYKESGEEESSEPEEGGMVEAGAEMPEEGGDGTVFDSFEDALRGILRLYKANPIGASPMAQMKAGYGSEEDK